jgi:hypothetical protein
MKRVLPLLLLAALSTGCVPAAYAIRAAGARHRGADLGGLDRAPLPVGRWDNVMMLAAGTPVQVLTMDGAVAAGPLVAADSVTLRIRVASGEAALAAADVMRVDQVGSSDTLREGVRGAAYGAGAVGVLGLIVGHLPPPRLFLAGGIIGGNEQIQLARLGKGSRIIYLSPAVAPASPIEAESKGERRPR